MKAVMSKARMEQRLRLLEILYVVTHSKDEGCYIKGQDGVEAEIIRDIIVTHPKDEGCDVEGQDGVPVEDDGEAEDEIETTSGILQLMSTTSSHFGAIGIHFNTFLGH